MTSNDETDLDIEIRNLEEKLSKLEGRETIYLNGETRKSYQTHIRKILNLCGLSKKKIHNLRNMDTHKFQKLEIPLSQKKLMEQMNILNDSLEGCTYYGTCHVNGNEYLTQEE